MLYDVVSEIKQLITKKKKKKKKKTKGKIRPLKLILTEREHRKFILDNGKSDLQKSVLNSGM